MTSFVDVCLFCEASGSDCRCGSPDPCFNCGFITCVCRPAPCCGMVWAPLDWRVRSECGWCGTPISRRNLTTGVTEVVVVRVSGTRVLTVIASE